MDEQAQERKRKRLEAWRRKQQRATPPAVPPAAPAPAVPGPPKPKIKFSGVSLLTTKARKKDKKKKNEAASSASTGKDNKKDKKRKRNMLWDDDDADADDENDDDHRQTASRKKQRPLLFTLDEDDAKNDGAGSPNNSSSSPSKSSRKSRWDSKGAAGAQKKKDTKKDTAATSSQTASTAMVTDYDGDDALDKFMDQLQSGENSFAVVATTTASSSTTTAAGGGTTTTTGTAAASSSTTTTGIHIGGSMVRPYHPKKNPGNVVGAENRALLKVDLARVSAAAAAASSQGAAATDDDTSTAAMTPLYSPKDWESDVEPMDEEKEEEARRALISALIQGKPAEGATEQEEDTAETADDAEGGVLQLASQVKNEKHRREELVKSLEDEATRAKKAASVASQPETGRLWQEDFSGANVMEEAERELMAAKQAPDALHVLAELNKKKELKAVDHDSIDYIPFQKNLLKIPRHLAGLTNDEIVDRRAKLKVRVRGHGAPCPVSTFEECGLSEKIIHQLKKQGIATPFPVQAQCIPCIMAGRDVIGIARTGSGKTLAYVLPLLRHIMVQPPLAANESGPIGLILAPARELAWQICLVCRNMCKHLGLRATAVYGGAGVAEQIGDLKRGTHIVVATPGRLIDILTMQSGKILSLQRVSYVCFDECDRMYDMGFEPQISALLSAVRPDRQTVLFSATFPKAVEQLARQSLKYPIEVIVGGRSVASDNVTQYAEVVEEDEKFLRLLQLLGEYVEGTSKVIVFVDSQVRSDNLFEQLLRSGYPALSLHGGKEQEDRDSAISDFKRKDGPNVLVATGVAGRGLDVPACVCVINYSTPNHLEEYVHRIGRTGRASAKGHAYTFVSSTDEAKYAPIIVRALSEAGQSENIAAALTELSDDFKAKVAKGEARYAGSGFKGKGYTYDASEMNEYQKVAQLEKRQALIEAGALDPEDETENDPMKLLMAKTAETRNKTDKSQSSAPTATGGKQAQQTNSESTKSDAVEIPANLTPELLALPGMKEALLRKAGITSGTDKKDSSAAKETESPLGRAVQVSGNHWLMDFEINDYPREARWRVTQKETTSRLQDEFRTAVTLKGSYFGPGSKPPDKKKGERRLYLHLEAASDHSLKNCVAEIQRLLNEETLRVGAKLQQAGGSSSGGGTKYSIL